MCVSTTTIKIQTIVKVPGIFFKESFICYKTEILKKDNEPYKPAKPKFQ